MIKTAIGQVKLVNETLKKAPETPPSTPAPAPTNMEEAKQANRKTLTDMFSKMNEHAAIGKHKEAHEVKGQIKDFALKAPRGSIDVGHMGMMRENQLKVGNPDAEHEYQRVGLRPLKHDDMAEVINHHLGDAKSLKDIYQNHGGDDTIKTLMHTMGANGEPREYSSLKFSKPGLHEDLLDLVWEGKADEDRKQQRHKGVFPKAYFSNTPVDPALDAEVHRTGESLHETDEHGDMGYDDVHKMQAHSNAVVARGLERFKRHHKLP